MEPVKRDKEKLSSSGKIRLILLIFNVLLVCVGCVIGLWVLTQRISKMEERLQESWNETCSQQKSEPHDDSTKLRARRDITLATIEDVRNEIRAQLRSVIASQVCSIPGKVCSPGTPGAKGEPGLPGRIGKKGGPGQTGDAYFGPKGDPGFDGVTGKPGDPGPKGYRGDKGDTGDPGSPGSSSRGGSGDSNRSIPTVYVFPDVLHVVENAPASFKCTAFGRPTPSVMWKRAGRGVVMNSDGNLTITQARPEDAGNYVCTAFNGVGKANATAELIVQGKPAIFRFTWRVTAKLHDDVRLVCQAKGYPRPTVKWARADSRTLPQDRAEREGNNLVIRKIRLEDSGVYVCRARNFYGTVRNRVQVSIIPRTGKNRKDAVRNCKELQAHFPGVPSGTYWVDLDLGSADNAFQTYCDQDTDGGGWTLVWSYVIVSPPRSHFTPRPDFPGHGFDIHASPISYTPPLNESYRGALNFSLWSAIGREVLLKSNLINWLICKDDSGSIVTFRPGNISCRSLESPKNVPYCDAYPTTIQTGFDFGFTLSSRASRYSSLYKVVMTSFPGVGDALLDACGRGQPKQNIKKNVDIPEGSWYIR